MDKKESTKKEIEPIFQINSKHISGATVLTQDNIEFETQKNATRE